MEPAIRAVELCKRFGRRMALDHLDLEVPPGVVFGYLGPNGAGKTTTIRVLLGLLRPSEGHAEILGLDVARQRQQVHRNVGYLPGSFSAYPDLTGAEYLSYLSNIRGVDGPAVYVQLAKRFGLDLDQRIATLSRGNRQKVGIIQAFMHDPPVIVLDEPSSGLDPLVQREFLDLVRETRDGGHTVFLSSHILSEVEAVADSVTILRSGRPIVTRTVQSLKEEAVRHIDLEFERIPPLETIRQLRGVQDVTLRGTTAHVAIAGGTADLLRVAAPHGVQNIVTHEADLEEIFLSYYAEGQ
jgi:ABC-2 type transport system ATP-binding protein